MINYSNPSFTEHTTVVDTYLSPKAKRFCVRVALFGSIGGLLFGYDLGVVAGANFQLAESMGLSFLQQDLFVSALLVGATVGAPLGGLLTDRLGRLRAIMLTDFCFIIGTVFLCAAQGLPMLFVGRFLIGVAVSVSAIADVAYLTEVSPHSVRGAIVSMNEIMISVGVLLSFFISFLLRDVTDGWRFMFGFTGVLAALQLLGMKTVPESPSWLFEHGQERAAMRVLHEIYGYRGAEDGGGTEQGGLGGAAGARGRGEQNGPLSSSASSTDALDPAAMGRGGDGEQDRSLRLVEAEAERIRKSQEASGGAHAIDLIRYWRPQLLVGLGLMMVQQLTGQANVLYYAPEVFARAGIKGSNYAATVGLGLVKVFFTAVAVLKVDHAGRRTLLLLGSIIMTCSLSVLGMSFLPFIRGTTTASALAFAGCCCVVAAYALGDGPITWLLTSEMFPSSLRGRAIGISLTANWLFNFAVTVRFLGCLHAVGEAATFFGMSILSLLGESLELKPPPYPIPHQDGMMVVMMIMMVMMMMHALYYVVLKYLIGRRWLISASYFDALALCCSLFDRAAVRYGTPSQACCSFTTLRRRRLARSRRRLRNRWRTSVKIATTTAAAAAFPACVASAPWTRAAPPKKTVLATWTCTPFPCDSRRRHQQQGRERGDVVRTRWQVRQVRCRHSTRPQGTSSESLLRRLAWSPPQPDRRRMARSTPAHALPVHAPVAAAARAQPPRCSYPRSQLAAHAAAAGGGGGGAPLRPLRRSHY